MDVKYRLLLQRHQQDIIKDLDVLDVLDKLFSDGGISCDDYSYIRSKTDRTERVRSLMNILIKKGTNKSYQAFVDGLAKYYDWLYDKFNVDNENEMIENSFEDSLSRGDVPRTPDYFVNRPLVEREVAKQLRGLTRHKILALYGMVGSGKTVVATSVLRHNRDLVTANFNSVVFWLNLSSCKTEDDIVAQQNKLYRKAATMYPTQNSLMNSSISMSSIGSNADSLTYNYLTGEELKDRLKLIFEEPLLKEALLVLDEVNMKKCLEAFDIGCKILITTRDTEVVSDFQAQKVKIENHLTEAETLELLATCLDIEVNALPPQAKKLHNLCGGSPYDIALLAAEFAENREMMVHNTSRWNYYIKKLKNKEFFSFTKNSNKQMNAIQVCVDLLKPDMLSLFKMLAVLPDNVKVPAQVFCKLWHEDIFKVESIIKQLKTKSLIIQTYDREQKIYLYEIDCLIMNYLRTISNADTLSKLHLDLLRSYNYISDTDVPVEIEDDGYIAYYVGYHLLNTNNLNNAWKMFSKLYLNLKFIGNKARLTGIADVNLDLQKYESHIVDNNHSKDLLYSLKAYLNRSGNDLHRFPCTDIVQSILQNESQGILYTAAYNVARERCRKNELYFEFLHEQNVEELNQSVIDVREVVTYVCFLGNFVLVGTNNGLIKFFQIDTNQLIKEISASGSGIKWLSACTVKPLLLVAALDYDGVLRVWHVDDVELEVGDVIEEEAEESYNNNYPSNITIPSGPFINCCWASIEEKLIAHTAKAIYIYRTDGALVQVLDNMYSDKRRVVCCVPCNYDKHVIVASTNSTNNLELIDLKTKVRQTLGTASGLVLNILVVPGSARFLVLTEQQVTEHWYHAGSRYERGERCRCVLSCAALRHVRLLSMAVSKSGALLLVATDDARILCVDLKTYLHVFDLQNRRGNVVSMAMSELSVWDDFEPGADVLLTGTGTVENSAKVWYLDAPFIKQNTDKNGKVLLTTKFDASFIHVTSPNTPGGSTSRTHTPHDTPKRHQSFNTSDQPRLTSRVSTMSLDRHSLKPLNLKGICNGSNDGLTQPLVAVVDDRSNIQVMRGTKLLTQVTTDEAETITALKITPCNHYVIYGLDTGLVKKYSIKTKEVVDIMDIYSRVEYLNFVNTRLLIVAGQNQRLMAYHYTNDGEWQTKMLQTGNANLGSQDLLNGIQGVKSRSRNDNASSSGSEDSEDKSNNSSDRKSLCKGSNLVDCFWVQEIGLVTVEFNATVKVWDKHLNVSNVLNGRQIDAKVKHAAMQKDILVLCHEYIFQTFRVQKQERISLRPLSEHFRSHRIVSCALTADGNILALGLETGDVVIWNVPKKWELLLLSHHKTRVQWCGFSPVPSAGDAEPPLVLLTLATELVWWDISYLRARSSQTRPSLDAVTPITSPVDTRKDMSDKDNASSNFFFGSEVTEQSCWKLNWRKKTYKEGSKKKEILSCIKLSGIYARQVCHDDKFACFVTVDDAGHLHIMSVMDDLGVGL